MKFGRTFQMIVQGDTDTWTFGPPFTLRFSVNANGTPTANTGDFFIYNLPEKVRNDILMDIYQDPSFRKISFAAGYSREPNTPVIFVGNVYWAYSYRQGPDWITQIHCVDGGGAIDIANVEESFVSGTSLGQIYRTLCQAMVGVGAGVTDFLVSSSFDSIRDPRGTVVSGSPWEELMRRIIPVNAQLFINKGKIYIVLQNEYVANPGGITEISADTGLIGSPRRQGSMTIATMVFEPRLEIGQQVMLKSAYSSGENKLLSVRHYGVISEAECGDLVTEATFLRPAAAEQVTAIAGVAA